MKRPVAIMVFGILNLVFALFGAFGIVSSIVLLSLPKMTNLPNPMIKMMQENAFYAAWFKVSLSLGAVACLLLLAAGVGLLKYQAWGRKASIAYAIYTILAGIVGLVINTMVLLPPVLNATNRQGPEYAGMAGGVIGGMVGGCVGLVYPVLLLIFMTRPYIAAALEPAAAAAPPAPQPPAWG